MHCQLRQLKSDRKGWRDVERLGAGREAAILKALPHDEHQSFVLVASTSGVQGQIHHINCRHLHFMPS